MFGTKHSKTNQLQRLSSTKQINRVQNLCIGPAAVEGRVL